MASEDLISKQAILDFVERNSVCGWVSEMPDSKWINFIKNLPFVQVPEKTGHWKKMVTVYNMVTGKYMEVPYTEADEKFKNPPIYKCNCGYGSFRPSNYCPDCGLKMEVSNENNR